MNKYSLTMLSAAGGILSGLAWSEWCSGLILFISFVPFLVLENHLFINRKRYSPNHFFIYLLPGFVIFTIITLGWMKVVTMIGAITVIIGLSFLMSFTMWLFHLVRLRTGTITGYISFILLWLGFEFITLHSTFITPWLNLGNGLSGDILFIQWYDITGVSGGSLWILCSNLVMARLIISLSGDKRKIFLYLTIWLSVIIVPSLISIIRFHSVQQSGKNETEVLIIQPNIDPYTEKFTIPFEKQMERAINMAEQEVTDRTAWVISPETTVDDPVGLNDLENDVYVKMVKEFAHNHPQVSFVTGMVSHKSYPPSTRPPTRSARKTDLSASYEDYFNSAFRIDTSPAIDVYHKSKLVPGIEMQFSYGPGRIAARILPDLGGTKWGYGIQEDRKCFLHPSSLQSVAPVICYESVFGKYVTDYINKGAESVFIITNDGWWKNSNGYKQHLAYSSLRAVETRRPVIRAANTGISCIINIKGERTVETGWWRQTTLKGTFFPEKRITPYVRYGDYILNISFFLSIIILVTVFLAIPIRKLI